jgi:hypothetical protein
MQPHGPDHLTGPVRGTTTWWLGMDGPPPDAMESPPPPLRKPGQRRRQATVRRELVDRVRREIAAGTYDTQEKWEAALDKLLDRLEPGCE